MANASCTRPAYVAATRANWSLLKCAGYGPAKDQQSTPLEALARIDQRACAARAGLPAARSPCQRTAQTKDSAAASGPDWESRHWPRIPSGPSPSGLGSQQQLFQLDPRRLLGPRGPPLASSPNLEEGRDHPMPITSCKESQAG